MPQPRILLLLILLFLSFSWLTSSGLWSKPVAPRLPKHAVSYSSPELITKKAKEKAAEAAKYIQRKGFNETTCFLIDISLPSGQNRFFIYDFKKDSILSAGLVTHGNCFESWLDGRRYSNVVGSGCTSLGKYRIGSSYSGKFGYSYKLHGLDSSNNNAFKRTVVLHAHSCVPEAEVSDEICQSNGCPTVSPDFLLLLKPIINTSRKPILLWIYE